MEFSVKKFDLLRELELTQGVVERKTTIPILSNLLFEAKANSLSITATDLELSIRTSCDARVKKEGAGTIPAKKLYDIIRLLPEAEIKFKLLENHWMQVTCERKNYKLVGMSKENFPALPSFPDSIVKLPAGLLGSLIGKTTFAISAEESRYTLNGALLVLKPASVTMVATDGHRLAMVESEHKIEGFSQETRVLVPKKAMTEIQRLASESGDDASVEFGQDESHLFFRFGQRLLTSRKLTGQFPNYEAVLPREANKSLVLERGELQDALRRVSQLADLRTHAVRFILAKEGVEISASSPEYGEAKEAIEKEYNGEPITIGFNAQYLLDFLAAAPEGPITFEMKDDQSASQLRPMADESSRYRYVVMPMRI
jgi:DNA polymerase-3 subunit beta